MFNEAQIIRTVFVDISNTEADKEFKRRAAFDKEFVESIRIQTVQTEINRVIPRPFFNTEEVLNFAQLVVNDRNVVPNDTTTYLGKIVVSEREISVLECAIRVKCRKWGSFEVQAHSLEPHNGKWFACLLFKGTVDQMVETLNAADESPAFSECL